MAPTEKVSGRSPGGPTPGESFGQYRVVDILGQGGMGVVYRAEDTQLGRPVALKFLPASKSRDQQARQRLLQEARSASALDHPNICTIYDIGRTEADATFIAMACYDGVTLADKLESGPLPLPHALELGVQIARGLAKAHAHNIVHRDVKPGNVMITNDGIVKLLDFGLAKLADSHLTVEGETVGTIAYMSPEQARGESTDHRTDIWAFGVVLYEMLSGVRPFEAEYPQAILYAVLNQDPEPLHSRDNSIPADVDEIVSTCLAKSPERRYPAADALLTDLEIVRQGQAVERRPARHIETASTPSVASIVVLPFQDISPNKDNEYFSDGLTDEIISDLAQVSSLRVISRTSAMMLKGSKEDIREIGRQLNVRYVLEGSVRKAGDQLRIVAQLVDAENQSQLWSEKYRGSLDDIFDIQEKVSKSIVDALQVKLQPEEALKIEARPIGDARAYECYLRARHQIFQFTEASLDNALQHLESGLRIVGDNALLYSGMGYVHWQYVNTGARDASHLDKAETYAHKIFAIDSSSAHGDRLLGLIELLRGNTRLSTIHLQRAIARTPNDPDALCWFVAECSLLGKPEAAEPLIERLLEIDPLTPLNLGMSAFHYLQQGKFEEALQLNRRMYEMDSANPLYRLLLAQSLAYAGKQEEAVAIVEQQASEEPEHLFTKMGLLLKHALEGRSEDAVAILTPEFEGATRGDLQWSWYTATCFALLDDRKRALDWLQNSVSRGFINYPFMATQDPFLANVRGEPEFKALMESVRPRWEQFAL